MGVINARISLDSEFLNLHDEVIVLRTEDLPRRRKGRFVLFSVIGSISLEENHDAPDLKKAVVEKPESRLVDFPEKQAGSFEVPLSRVQEVIKMVVARLLAFELSLPHEPS